MKPGWHICTVCNYIYEEAQEKVPAQASNPSFHDLPENWKCPDCGASKSMYQACSCVSISEDDAGEGKEEAT